MDHWALSSQPKRNYFLVFGLCVSLLLLAAHFRSSSPDLRGVLGQPSARWNGVSAARQRSLQPILNSTLGFEKILAINLAERTDHHDSLVLASAVSGLHIDFVEGVWGKDVSKQALPWIFKEDQDLKRIGSWRAHISAISKVVENGWSSALILEDDVDFDIRLKQQLQEFALGSDFVLRNLNSPGRHDSSTLKLTEVPKTSPYGDGWDVLWLGHCGMKINESSAQFVRLNDPSVPEHRYWQSWDSKAESPLKDYPQHTRVVMNQQDGVCTLAYAISQAGARSLLLSLGLRRFDNAFDLMFVQWCQGEFGDRNHVCIGVLPQLIDHYQPPRAGESNNEFALNHNLGQTRAHSPNIRWSVRRNMEKIFRGETDYDDEYPDS